MVDGRGLFFLFFQQCRTLCSQTANLFFSLFVSVCSLFASVLCAISYNHQRATSCSPKNKQKKTWKSCSNWPVDVLHRRKISNFFLESLDLKHTFERPSLVSNPFEILQISRFSVKKQNITRVYEQIVVRKMVLKCGKRSGVLDPGKFKCTVRKIWKGKNLIFFFFRWYWSPEVFWTN